MFTPRGYHAVPQDASQDEEENDNLTRSFEQRKSLRASRNSEAMTSPKTSGESEEGDKERRVKRNVTFDSRSLEDKPEPMSNARRLCFVISLMICTLTIFVFAFTVPCKGPSCNVANMITTVTSNLEKFHRNWSMAFPGYSTGIVFHLSSTKTREVVISYTKKGVASKQKHRSGNSGLISLREDNGGLVWLYNASNVIKLIECTTDNNRYETCLIQSSHGKLQLINPKRNQIVWSTHILIGSVLPSIIIGINDCDGDDGRDILLSYDHFNTTCMPPSANKTTCTHPGIVQLISGRTGYSLGSRLNIPQSHLIKRVSVHSTRHSENLIFVLTVGNKGHLKVISIEELYGKILESRGGESTYLFQNSTLSVSDIVSTDHEPVVKDLNKDLVEDIVLVTLAGSKHSLTAVDGGKLKKMWRIAFGSRKMLSQPVIGYFNDDDIPDILVILEDPVLSLLNQSLVQILDGQNGNILWSRKLRLAKNTTPLSASIGFKSDVFLLWIEKESKRKYNKTFLSRAAKDIQAHQETDTGHVLRNGTSSDTHNKSKKNISESSIVQEVKHHRSPRSVLSNGKKTSSTRDMEAELDSLVDEVFVEHVGNSPRTEPHEKPHLKAKKIENTHKMLEDFLKKEGKPSEVVNKNRPKLTTAPALHSKPTTKMIDREQVRQVTINSPATQINGRRPTTSSATNRPTLPHDIHIAPKKPSTTNSNSRRVALSSNSLQSGKHRITSTLTTEHPMSNDDIHVITKKANTKMSNRKRVQQFTRDNHGSGIKDKSDILTGTGALNRPLSHGNTLAATKKPNTEMLNTREVRQRMIATFLTRLPVPQNNIHTITKKPNIRMLTRESNRRAIIENHNKRVNGQRPTEHSLPQDQIHATTNTPNIKTSNRKIFQQVMVDTPNKRIIGIRESSMDTSPTERSMPQDEVHDITEKPRTISDSQRVRQVLSAGASGGEIIYGRQRITGISPTTHPESHGSVQLTTSKPAPRMVNGRKIEKLIIHSPVSRISDQVSNTGALDDFHSTEISHNKATSPTPRGKDQPLSKMFSDTNEKVLSKNSNIVADIHSTEQTTKLRGLEALETNSGRGTIGKILTTNNPPSATSLSRILSNHPLASTGITVKGMTSIQSESMHNKNRSSKAFIVLPTKSSITRQPTEFPGNNLQNKRLLKVNEPTRTNQNNSAFSDGTESGKLKEDVALGIRNEIVESSNNTRAPSSSQNVGVEENLNNERLLNVLSAAEDTKKIPEHNGKVVGSTGKNVTQVQYNSGRIMPPRRKPPTVTTNKKKAHHKSNAQAKVNHNRTILNNHHEKPSSKPRLYSETRKGKDTNVNKLDSSKEPNARSSLGKTNVNAKVKLHDRVALNARNKEEKAGHDMNNSHVLHSVKLNGTGHLKKKLGQVKPTKSKRPGWKGTFPKQQPLSPKITRSHHPKHGTVHATIKPRNTSSKKKYNMECTEGFDLSLIAVFPNGGKNSFSIISQENSVEKTKDRSARNSCHTLWPTLSSSPLVHDADSDGFLEIFYAVNYGTREPNERTMKVRKFSIKVDSE